MDKLLSEKIKKAERLRKKPGFLMSLFKEPDYIESGDLFIEVATECDILSDKVKYYQEAAHTFLKGNSEYNHYRASECYKRLFDTLQPHDVDTAADYYLKYAECLDKLSKHLMAGQAYVKIGDIFKDKNPKTAITMYQRAQESYRKDLNYTFHTKEAVQKCLEVQLKIEDLNGAIKSLNMLEDVDYTELCKHILGFILGVSDFESDALTKKESDLIMTLVNKDRETGIVAMEKFLDNYTVPDVVKKVFYVAIGRLRPENDIC